MTMNKVLVSACLLGNKVRYNGQCMDISEAILDQWETDGRIVAVCPEVDAGMSIPRPPAEISGGVGVDVWTQKAVVVSRSGEDVTRFFISGAKKALLLCEKYRIKVAVLTENSPSCGSTMVYDGRFAGQKIAGSGVTTSLLERHGIQVFNQNTMVQANLALHSL